MSTQLETTTAGGEELRYSEHWMTSWDGSELFYRAWQPVVPTQKALILLHRGHEHSGRLEDVVKALSLTGYSVFAWDSRGHGQSPGKRGHAPDFACLTRDLDSFVRHVSSAHNVPAQNIVVMAQSIAAVVLSTWVHDYAPAIRGMILVGPAFRVKLYVPFAIALLRALKTFFPEATVRSYVSGKMLTHDAEQARIYNTDPLVSKDVSVNVLLGLHDTSVRVVRNAYATEIPTLMLVAGADAVADEKIQKKFFRGLSSRKKELKYYPQFHHDILHEDKRDLAIAASKKFIEEVMKIPPEELSADPARLSLASKPAPKANPRRNRVFCAKSIKYAAIRFAFKTLGMLSCGIKLGWKYGFDSGRSLDYVYENKARGITFIGKLLDRMYLNSTGWASIRQRKANLERAIQEAIDSTGKPDRPVQVLDIAAGAGRYVLTALANTSTPVRAQLRDYDQGVLNAAKLNAFAMGISNVSFSRGDAFDEEALAKTEPRPDVAVVSGLYELFPDNEMISRSLRGLAASMEDGGYLIYTNQPWHPQLEFISRVLTNREGKPWEMRCRSQVEMDALVRAAGFEKVSTTTDEHGIFTVSVARKPQARALGIPA